MDPVEVFRLVSFSSYLRLSTILMGSIWFFFVLSIFVAVQNNEEKNKYYTKHTLIYTNHAGNTSKGRMRNYFYYVAAAQLL